MKLQFQTEISAHLLQFMANLGLQLGAPFNLKTTAKVESETSWSHRDIPLQVSLEILR